MLSNGEIKRNDTDPRGDRTGIAHSSKHINIETAPLKVVAPYMGSQEFFQNLDLSRSDKNSIS